MEYKQEYHENMIKSFEKVRTDTDTIKINIEKIHTMQSLMGAGFVLMAIALIIVIII